MLMQLDADNACRLMVEALYIAAKQDKEQSVAIYLQAQLQADTLSLVALQQHFHLVNHPNITVMQVQQHSLGQYDLITKLCPPYPSSPPRCYLCSGQPHKKYGVG